MVLPFLQFITITYYNILIYNIINYNIKIETKIKYFEDKEGGFVLAFRMRRLNGSLDK